ncbi:MAG: DUF6054 family protein [Clostridiales bacterium]|nr:DUF6054 family protein [Clostridiales bacterium]
MAKYENTLIGNFDAFLHKLDNGILRGSASASFEDGSDYRSGDIRCAVRVYERYSMIGSNRVSINITLIGNGDDLFLSAITSGGSQAIFFKINTMGEKSFLNRVIDLVEDYKRENR